MKYILIGMSINLFILILNVSITRCVIDSKLSKIIELLEGEENEQ